MSSLHQHNSRPLALSPTSRGDHQCQPPSHTVSSMPPSRRLSATSFRKTTTPTPSHPVYTCPRSHTGRLTRYPDSWGPGLETHPCRPDINKSARLPNQCARAPPCTAPVTSTTTISLPYPLPATTNNNNLSQKTATSTPAVITVD